MNLEPFQKHYQNDFMLRTPGLVLKEHTKYALIGPNGSGKSTFARIVAGIEEPDSRCRVIPPEKTVGYMPQKSYGYRMSVLKNLLLKNPDFQRADILLKKMGIDALSGRNASRLSGGETARMALARLLMTQYDILILDEPTAAMDMESTQISEKAVLDYQKETGCILLWITHSISQARRISDEILFFYKGNLTESGSTDTVLNQPSQSETQKFLSFWGS